MLYVIATLQEESSWSLGARLYMRALALTDFPFRLLWTAKCTSTRDYSADDVPPDSPRDGMVHSFSDIFDPSLLPKALRCLKPHIGPGAPPIRQPSAMLFIGEVIDAVERISRPDECPKHNIVMTSWPADTIPIYLASQLLGYDLVLVPEGEGQAFRAAELPNVVEMPWPQPRAEDAGRDTPRPPAHVTRLLCAAGSWNGEDNVQDIADAFVRGFKRSDGVGLVLACSDVPREWPTKVAAEHGRGSLPFMHVVPAPHADPTGLDALLAGAHAFVDASRRVHGSFWRRQAEAAGCPIVEATGALEPCSDLSIATSFASDREWPGVTPAQHRRAPLPPLDLIRSMQSTPARPDGGKRSSAADVGEQIADLVGRVIAGESFMQAPQRVSEGGGIGVVVPFSGDDEVALWRCLAALQHALRPADRAVVSVRGDTEAAQRVCRALSVACIQSTSGGERWNMSAVRNAGWRWLAERTSCRHVAFVDADVAVPEDYLAHLAREAYKRPGVVLTPYVVDEGADALASSRIASGMSMYPLEALQQARGFPESFVGWGHEDIALLHVLRDLNDTPATPLPDIVALHAPHAPRVGSEQQRVDHADNLKRYQEIVNRIDAGENVELNTDGAFGTYTETFAP